MRYYNSKMKDKMPILLDATLQRYFPDNNKWGANVLFFNDKVENIEICSLWYADVNKATWVHYADIFRYGEDVWEVHTRFNGEKENEMWIYKYFQRFSQAVRFVKNEKWKGMKPIQIYP